MEEGPGEANSEQLRRKQRNRLVLTEKRRLMTDIAVMPDSAVPVHYDHRL